MSKKNDDFLLVSQQLSLKILNDLNDSDLNDRTLLGIENDNAL